MTIIDRSGKRRQMKIGDPGQSVQWRELPVSSLFVHGRRAHIESIVLTNPMVHTAHRRCVYYPAGYFGPLEGEWEWIGECRGMTVYVEDTEAFDLRFE